MAELLGYTDLEQAPDGSVTALKHVEGREPERVSVRVSIEREHHRADGSLVSSGEVASSDTPAGVVGSVAVGA